MAEITQTRVLPPEFIEAAGKVALGDLATATGQFKTADLSKVFGPISYTHLTLPTILLV